FRRDPEKHVFLHSVEPLGLEPFKEALTLQAGSQRNTGILLFVHGFNVTFAAAVRRTAQIAYDLAFDGPVVLFSWPSKGEVLGYSADAATVEWAAPHLKQLLMLIRTVRESTSIHVVAHSIGNRSLLGALKELVAETEDVVLPTIDNLVLTAPDV